MSMKRKKNNSINQKGKRMCFSQSTDSFLESSMSQCTEIDPEADVGTIVSVSVKNFMCHPHLEFNFSKNINFIIGKNGSGKSAILTALIVAFGGKAAITGRGRAIKDFIRNGKRSAEIVVKLRNCGHDAFDHDKYGDIIIIERHLSITGTSSYKLKSESGVVISDKREDLFYIADQFNIQVDNPVSILNQEVSRHFLNSSSPHDKYKFFLKATQLEQIEREYCDADESKRISRDKLERKNEILMDMEKEVQLWRKRYRMLQSLNELRQKIATLKNESAWAQVIEKEQALQRAEQELKDERDRHLRYDQKVKECQGQNEEAKNDVNKVKENLTVVSTALDSLQPKFSESKVKLDEERKKYKMAVMEHRKVLTMLQPLIKDRDSLRAKIEELRLTQSQDVSSETQQRQRDINKKNEQKEELQGKHHMTSLHCSKLKSSISTFDEQLQKLSCEERDYRHQADQKRLELQNMEASRNNHLRRFGQWVPGILAKIDDAFKKGRFSKKPRGPIGACLKLRDSKWALAVECCLKNMKTTFCCNDYNDEKVLEELLQSMGIQQRPMIIVSTFSSQVYNVQRHAVTLANHWSVLDALVFDDPVVANCCIDQRGIESVLLFESGDEALKVLAKPLANCHEAFTQKGDQVYPSPNLRFYSCKIHRAQWLQSDVEGNIQILKEEQKGFELRSQSIKDGMAEVNAEKKKNINSLQDAKLNLDKLAQEISHIHKEILELKAVDETELIDVTVLEKEVEEHDKQIETLETKKDQTKEELLTSKELVGTMETEMDEVHKKILSIISNKVDPLKDNMAEAEQEVNRTSQKLKHYEAQKNEHAVKLNDLDLSCQRVMQMVEEKQKMAERICERLHTRRTAAQLDKEIDQYMQQLHHQEQNHGSKEEVTTKYHEAKIKYDAICQDVSSLQKLLEHLDKILKVRKTACSNLRHEMGTRVRQMFIVCLEGRNFKGKIDFDHDREMLNINVQPLKQIKENVKDLKSLSGGERSYSTVCFILSLWEATESPFRILDEFDVFMDMVTRRFCMELMLNSAKDKQNKQFIFLTPQDLSAMCEMPDPSRLKVFRMHDPVRTGNNDTKESQE